MKKLFLVILALCLSLAACQQREYVLGESAFEQKDGTQFGLAVDSEGKPITGKVNPAKGNTSKGSLSSIRAYKNGHLNGVTSFYRDGILEAEINFKNNVQHGATKLYYKNGELKSEETVIDGLRHGEYLFYNEDGSLSVRVTLEYGRYIEGWIFDKGFKRPFTELEGNKWKESNKKWLVKDE